MTLLEMDFQKAVTEFTEFLGENGLSGPLLWAFREDVISQKSGVYKAAFLVRLPLPNINNTLAERHFEIGKSKGLGMALTAYASCDEGLLCSFVVPVDQEDSEYLMLWPDQIRYSFVQNMPTANVVRHSTKWGILTISPWYKNGNHFVYLESKENLSSL